MIFAAILLCFGVCSAEGDQWAEIEKAGVIRFGVASDYIPFVYTEGTELDGMDIALVKEMGRRLGVTVKPIDMAFSGLIDALLIGQVDLIGGAFSITESRSEVVDYTSAYYQAGGIFLCRVGEEVTKETIRNSRVGVMRGTSFEQWVASNLIMEGQVSPASVFTFGKIDEVVTALKEKRVDIVLIDEDVYRSRYKNDPDLVGLGETFANERYAYAAAKGSTLIPKLNAVLREMFLDGTAQKIADEYFRKDFSDRIVPSITRTSQIEIAPDASEPADMAVSREITLEDLKADNKPTCRNGMMFVSDVSIPDGTKLLPGMQAKKTWNILNTGTCTWDSGYTFNYVKGSVFGPTTVKIDKLVAPGENYQVSVDFVTPEMNGEYTAWWQMRNPDGVGFGQTIWYDFIVSSDKGSSDQKVQQSAPQILKWYPDYYSTDSGKCPRIYYQVINAYQVEFYINNQLVDTSKNLSGYNYICAPKKAGTYTYGIRALGETAVSDAFQFMDQTRYPDPMLGVPAEWPKPNY